jgi:hypothetical protein
MAAGRGAGPIVLFCVILLYYVSYLTAISVSRICSDILCHNWSVGKDSEGSYSCLMLGAHLSSKTALSRDVERPIEYMIRYKKGSQ